MFDKTTSLNVAERFVDDESTAGAAAAAAAGCGCGAETKDKAAGTTAISLTNDAVAPESDGVAAAHADVTGAAAGACTSHRSTPSTNPI